MRAYSMDLRERIAAALDEGQSSLQVAKRFGVHDSWVRKLSRRRRRTGSIAPKPHAGGRDRILGTAVEQQLRATIEERNDITLEELRQWLGGRGIHVSLSSVWRAVGRLNLTLKKNAARLRA